MTIDIDYDLTIGMYEARTKFSEIARRIQHGERVLVTNNGQPVLEMGPVGHMPSPAMQRQKVVEEIIAFRGMLRERWKAQGLPPMTSEEIVSLVHEGRRTFT